MRVDSLITAYDRLGKAVAALRPDGTGLPDKYSTAPWILAYLILCDELYISAGNQVLDNKLAELDNTTVMVTNHAGTLVATHSWPELVARVNRTASQLIALVERIRPEQGDRFVRVVLHNRQLVPVMNEWITWHNLVKLHAEDQVPQYTGKLLELFSARTDLDHFTFGEG